MEKYLAEKIKIIDSALDKYVPADNSKITEAIRYSLLSPGKRIRPILSIATAEMLGADIDTVLPTAAALEMIHAYSLIHDDLPAMDNDDFRRGKPANHKVFGEAMAILAGDALSALAIETIATHTRGVKASKVIDVIREITAAMGIAGMAGGQAEDILDLAKDMTSLKALHQKKTGALISASVRTGAILAGAKIRQLKNLSNFANSLGFTFQIIDDILDETASFQDLGKTPGKDQKSAKLTMSSHTGIEKAKRLAEKEKNKALDALESFGPSADILRDLFTYVISRKG
ncbi:MAG: farnesyl diphosphate synthase [bacterium]